LFYSLYLDLVHILFEILIWTEILEHDYSMPKAAGLKQSAGH